MSRVLIQVLSDFIMGLSGVTPHAQTFSPQCLSLAESCITDAGEGLVKCVTCSDIDSHGDGGVIRSFCASLRRHQDCMMSTAQWQAAIGSALSCLQFSKYVPFLHMST